MKKLIILFVLSVVAYSATPPAYVGAISEWEAIPADTVKKTSDSLVGATDSSKLFNDYKPEHDWEYIISFGTTTDAGSLDSSKLAVIVRPQDAAGTPICTVTVDTIYANVANGECILIPFGVGNCFGTSYDILVSTFAGAGNRATIGRVQMYKRRPVLWQKIWR